MINISQIIAITKKEIKLNFRFKWNYFGAALLDPFKFIVLFATVYSSFFWSGLTRLGEVTKLNFISFLVLGGLVHVFFDLGYGVFERKFRQEKYWQTIHSFLIAPVSKLKLLISIGLAELLRLGIAVIIYLGIAYLVMPVIFINLILTIAIILLLYFGTLGFGLIIGASFLADEDTLIFFDYIYLGWCYISCFYYPLASVPKFLRPLAEINPIYHGVAFIREIWLGLPGDKVAHLAFVVIFAILTPIIGSIFFNEIVRRKGVTGY